MFLKLCLLGLRSPTFLASGTDFVEDSFSTDQGGVGGGLGMIQAHCISCALYCYYCYISSTSDHQALDSGGWGPLSHCIHSFIQLEPSALSRPWTSPLERAPMGQEHGGRWPCGDIARV